MSYIKLSTMEYPLYEGDIRLSHPDIQESQTGESFPIPDDYAFVEETAMPSIDVKTQYMYEETPQLINGAWKRIWVVGTYTDEQIAARASKAKPNNSVATPDMNASGSAPDVI